MLEGANERGANCQHCGWTGSSKEFENLANKYNNNFISLIVSMSYLLEIVIQMEKVYRDVASKLRKAPWMMTMKLLELEYQSL